MDFEHYSTARDFFYLSALLLGAGLGCILHRFRKKSTTHSKNMSITAGLCFFSGTAAALTAAVIFSDWMILREIPLYHLMGILAVIFILAFRFPGAAGFPLLLVSGIFIVLLASTCLRFPVIDDSGQVRVTKDGKGLIHVQPVLPNGENPVPSFSFEPSGEDDILEFRSVCISFPPEIPLIGGVSRGFIAEIRNNNTVLYPDTTAGSNSSSGPAFGRYNNKPGIMGLFFPFREASEKLEVKKLFPGASLTLFFEKTGDIHWR